MAPKQANDIKTDMIPPHGFNRRTNRMQTKMRNNNTISFSPKNINAITPLSNSSIELLRITADHLIVFRHFNSGNSDRNVPASMSYTEMRIHETTLVRFAR